jgi:hypothetical protein
MDKDFHRFVWGCAAFPTLLQHLLQKLTPTIKLMVLWASILGSCKQAAT